MLERILEKLGFDTVEAVIKDMNDKIEENKGYEAEYKNPFAVLDIAELTFFQNYVNEHGLA